MTYLEQIVKYARGLSGVSFRNNIFMGNDINAIDVAYSDTENHKLSAFFVPAETISKSGEMGQLVDTKFFNIYIFVPVEEDVAATVAWETAINASQVLIANMKSHYFNKFAIKFLSSREFRVGRGYYIYVMNCSIDTLSGSEFRRTITYVKYKGETNGAATYAVTKLSSCTVDENFALNRMVNGIYRNFGCEVIIGQGVTINPTQKDWFVVDNYQGNYTKADAIASGSRVYEVNQWKKYWSDDESVIGIRLIGV